MAEKFSQWTVVNLVFNRLAEEGLHPVLGDTGDPAEPAAQLLRSLGIEPSPEGSGHAQAQMQQDLAELRARMLPEP